MTTKKEEISSTTVVEETKEEPKKATNSKKSDPDFEQKVEEGQESTLRDWVFEAQVYDKDGSFEWKAYTARASSEKEVLRLANHESGMPYRLKTK